MQNTLKRSRSRFDTVMLAFGIVLAVAAGAVIAGAVVLLIAISMSGGIG